ncbi:heat-inducible transcriptional repressor HrcA [Ferviditalea candida]|uniref:Heat-inducible transcription repressor HrcA n=1 Tax=Ferviditalea candida TaxID=3108399 RepID=A0ABU5ZDX5_9BACL|nr:heat-inducible transcriptional repressor HrcA [Paenibacillaceae bacterium T2]
MLTERQKMILSAIIDDYIRSAEPVGSRSISKREDVGFSPATIRNEMSDLEEMGYLEQPHTSAGRIPSHKGYRYYVDHLIKPDFLSNRELEVYKHFFAEKIQEIEGVVQQAAVILSSLTNYTSIVLGPEIFTTSLRHLQLLPLDKESAVAIIVTSTGHVENKTVSIPPGVPMSEIEKMVAILNDKLKGVPLLQLKSKLYSEISEELKKHVSRYESLFQIIQNVLDQREIQRVFLGGTTNILSQPEFKDVEKVKTILDLFDETEKMVKLVSSNKQGIQVRIGTENSMEAINNCSLITATYSIDGMVLGTVGVIGPTRMEYGKVIGLLDRFSRDLELMMRRWYK